MLPPTQLQQQTSDGIDIAIRCWFDNPADPDPKGSNSFIVVIPSTASVELLKKRIKKAVKPALHDVSYSNIQVWPAMTRLLEGGLVPVQEVLTTALNQDRLSTVERLPDSFQSHSPAHWLHILVRRPGDGKCSWVAIVSND
jgi:hypothetical protein